LWPFQKLLQLHMIYNFHTKKYLAYIDSHNGPKRIHVGFSPEWRNDRILGLQLWQQCISLAKVKTWLLQGLESPDFAPYHILYCLSLSSWLFLWCWCYLMVGLRWHYTWMNFTLYKIGSKFFSSMNCWLLKILIFWGLESNGCGWHHLSSSAKFTYHASRWAGATWVPLWGHPLPLDCYWAAQEMMCSLGKTTQETGRHIK
jgi:hypothetical protein